jgi:hypothetical protein
VGVFRVGFGALATVAEVVGSVVPSSARASSEEIVSPPVLFSPEALSEVTGGAPPQELKIPRLNATKSVKNTRGKKLHLPSERVTPDNNNHGPTSAGWVKRPRR